MAHRDGVDPYSVAELSDGERSAFLIASAVLTAKSNTLILIDEPERHLHRSIISPLLTLLFEKRPDCAFVVSTHEVMLPIDNPSASTLLIRSCQYENSTAMSWKVDLLPPSSSIDDMLKRDILGARQKVIFVEGTRSSLDAPLYSILFPDISIISRESCRDVESAVRSLRNSEDLHWIKAWGIVDYDGRSDESVVHLRENNIHALPFFSVEALYFLPEIVRRISNRQSIVTGGDANEICSRAICGALEAVKNSKTHLISRIVERYARRRVFELLPSRNDIGNHDHISIDVDIESYRVEETKLFNELVSEKNYIELLRRYPLRETGAFGRIAAEIGLKMRKYEDAVRKLLQEDKEVYLLVRGYFDSLVSDAAVN